MCGIVGCLVLNNGGSSEHLSGWVGAMCDKIVHRGPDGQGQFVEGPIGMGMRRLAVRWYRCIQIASPTAASPATANQGSIITGNIIRSSTKESDVEEQKKERKVECLRDQLQKKVGYYLLIPV